jgi:hypothetical protein
MQSRIPLTVLAAALSMAALSTTSYAQDAGFNLDVHANSHVTAKEIGLPVYPGATPWKSEKDTTSGANLGFGLNAFHFTLLAASYASGDSTARVLDFYRKPLSKYGEVLECSKGKPVGALTATKSGLTCSSSDKGGKGNLTVNGDDSSKDHELRAGVPHKFHIVGVDTTDDGKTKIGLVYLELPKDDDAKD